jgi:hypothetical protein
MLENSTDINNEIVQAEACIVERLGRYLSHAVIQLTPRLERVRARLIPSKFRSIVYIIYQKIYKINNKLV